MFRKIDTKGALLVLKVKYGIDLFDRKDIKSVLDLIEILAAQVCEADQHFLLTPKRIIGTWKLLKDKYNLDMTKVNWDYAKDEISIIEYLAKSLTDEWNEKILRINMNKSKNADKLLDMLLQRHNIDLSRVLGLKDELDIINALANRIRMLESKIEAVKDKVDDDIYNFLKVEQPLEATKKPVMKNNEKK